MKHHVILMVESIFLSDTYLIEEWNLEAEDKNEIEGRGLIERLRSRTQKEVREELSLLSFVQRSWEHGGQASMTEIILAETGLITIFFFNTLGLPTRGYEYELKLPER